MSSSITVTILTPDRKTVKLCIETVGHKQYFLKLQTDRQTDRQTDAQTHRHTDRHTDRDTQTDRHRHITFIVFIKVLVQILKDKISVYFSP